MEMGESLPTTKQTIMVELLSTTEETMMVALAKTKTEPQVRRSYCRHEGSEEMNVLSLCCIEGINQLECVDYVWLLLAFSLPCCCCWRWRWR